jgi:tetratricopeptide (TPR) repeat protein
MDRFTQSLNKGQKAVSQLSVMKFHPEAPCEWHLLLAICFFSLVMYPMVYVETAVAHRGMDPDIDEITHELEENPENVELLIKRGRLYRTNGEFPDSLKDLDLAAELNPDNRKILFERSFTLSAMGRDREAEVALDQYLEQASGRTRLDALAERARIRARTGQAALAIDDFNSAISIHPAMALYLARGELHESLGHLEEAASGYREGLSQLGNAILLKKGLIRVETARKRYDEVLPLIDEELDRASVKTEWHLRRAEVLAAMGKDQAAQSAHEQALAESNLVLGKRVTAIHLVTRAKVYIAMGRLQQAKHELQMAVQRAPRFSEASELLKKLEADYPSRPNEVPNAKTP